MSGAFLLAGFASEELPRQLERLQLVNDGVLLDEANKLVAVFE